MGIMLHKTFGNWLLLRFHSICRITLIEIETSSIRSICVLFRQFLFRFVGISLDSGLARFVKSISALIP